ncbi:hypothetical protein [Paraclostridium sordellii]|uniref:hypothetical protein n=1 Tax=Paraclostridium sordellii TaxID=1505 RepID=UPI002E8E3827|nr:hypothetical protein [Paeniclostridium sordellii]
MSNLAKSAFWLMVVTMLSKVLGFAREIVLGYFYGTSAYSDIYNSYEYTTSSVCCYRNSFSDNFYTSIP